MAQNVTIMGADYSAVPAVELPKTGGGTAKFTDASVTTATATDVASGKIFLSFDGTITIGTAAGTANGDVWQDAQGYVHLSDAQGTNVGVDELTVTANGTYTAPSGWAYNPVKVNLPTTSRAVPSISVSSGGLITETYTQTDGVVSSGTETATQQLTTQAAKTVTPTESQQTAVASGRYTTGAVTVGAISSTYVGSGIAQRTSSNLSASGATVTAPAGYYASSASKSVASGSATAPASISGTSATLSTGTNTLTLSKTVSVTPSVSAGYVSSGTAGNSSVSLTASVTTKAAATITPGTTNQTIASGTYLTGTQTISGDANLIAGNIKKDVVIFGTTGTYEGDAPAPTPRTATITSTGSSTYAYASYNNTKYYSSGSTFTFTPGDTLLIHLEPRNSGTTTVTVNGVVVATQANYINYNYVLPDSDISIALAYNSSSATANITVAPSSADISFANLTISTDMLLFFPHIVTMNGTEFINTFTQDNGTFQVPLYKGSAVIMPDHPSVATLSGNITDVGGAYLLTDDATATITTDPDY